MELQSSARASAPHAPTLKILLFLALIAATAEFVVRGPLRFLDNPTTWTDLSQNYVASKLWLAGENPCNPNNFVRVWKKEGRSRLEATDIRTHLAPPLGVLVLLSPIAVLPWPIAKVAWLAILLLVFCLALWSLLRVAGFQGNTQTKSKGPRTLLFLTGSLGLAPLHTGFASGNSSILAIGICAIAIWAASVRRDVMTGILLGLAASLKPQIGALFVFYYLLRRRWRTFFIAAGLTAVLALGAALRLQLHDPSWSHDFANNAKGFVTADTIDDFRASNPIRFTLINLQVLIFALTGRASTANLLALVLGVSLICVWMYYVLRRSGDRSELLDLGSLSVLGLLPVYHRFYDAAVLIVPMCWCLTRPAGKLKNAAVFSLILMIPFLAPGAAWLQLLALQGKIGAAITSSWWWDGLIMPHEVWALLFLGLILLYGVASYRNTPNPECDLTATGPLHH